MKEIILLIISWFIIFIIGISVGHNTKKEELEKKVVRIKAI